MNRSRCLAVFRGILLVWVALFIVVAQSPALALKLKISEVLPRLWHGWCCRILGMDVEVRGSPLVSGPALFVSNHVSYLDVTAIGSVVDGSFVSRADVRDWPIFGYLSRLQKTVFIERRPRYARQQLLELSGRLRSGDRLILFPEGTSSDGNMILPFKSALFAVAETRVDGRSIPVQPISIAYTRLDGLPLGRLLRPIYAWYGDMDFAPHFWQLLGYGRFRVEITIHDPVRFKDFESRKVLAEYCEQIVVRGFTQSLSGRPTNAIQSASRLTVSSAA